MTRTSLKISISVNPVLRGSFTEISSQEMAVDVPASDLKNEQTDAMQLILQDNQAAICVAKNAQFHGRAEYIDKYHFIRGHIGRATVKVGYCTADEMIADIFTRGLRRSKFTKFRKMLGVRSLNS